LAKDFFRKDAKLYIKKLLLLECYKAKFC